MKNRFLISVVALFFSMRIFAQTNCLMFDMSNREPVFQSGEKITYTATYSLVPGNVGEVVFTTTQRREQGRDIFHIEARGRTYSFYDNVFRVRDVFATKMDAQTLQPLWKHRDVSEGKYRLKSTGHFDWENNT